MPKKCLHPDTGVSCGTSAVASWLGAAGSPHVPGTTLHQGCKPSQEGSTRRLSRAVTYMGGKHGC